MTPSRALAYLSLLFAFALPALAAPAFEGLFAEAKSKARAAYLSPSPILVALPVRELSALSDERVLSGTAPGRRRDLVVEFIEILEKVAALQGRPGQPPPPSAGKRELARAVARYFALNAAEYDAARSIYRVDGDGPGPFANAVALNAATLDFNRAGSVAGRIDAAAAGWTSANPGALVPGTAPNTLAAGGSGVPNRNAALPNAQLPQNFSRSAVAPPNPEGVLLGVREQLEKRSRDANAKISDEFREQYQRSSLIFKDATEYWTRHAEGGFQPGDTVAGATFRATVGTIAQSLLEPLRLVERNVQHIAYRGSDARRSRRTGEGVSIRPDGYGITVILSNGVTRRSFRNPDQGKAFLESLPPAGARRVVFYGHGGPGLQTVGDDFFLEAADLETLLRGKMQPGGRVDLIGCNTAGIGERSIEDGNVAGMAGFGLSSLTRRLMYFSAPKLISGDDKTAAQWNRDLAQETSARLPGVYVTGMRTFAFPLDRLIDLFVPGGDDAAPSDVIIARRAVYLNGRETRL